MQGNDALTAVLPVIAALDRLGVPYYVGGSLASTAHGVMRASVDADLIADLKPQRVDALVEALQGDYYIDARMIRGAISTRSCFNLIHLATSFKVDIFVLKGRPYDRTALARKRSVHRPRIAGTRDLPRHGRRHDPGQAGMVSTRQRNIRPPME